MREICQSGSMSGNRKQNQANRTEVTRRKPSQITTGRLRSLRLFSTLLPIALIYRGSKQFSLRSLVTPGFVSYLRLARLAFAKAGLVRSLCTVLYDPIDVAL